MAFHDLTKQGEIPATATSLLGLGLKFIPTPKYTSNQETAEKAFARINRDVGLKVFFAGEDSLASDKITRSKLYIKSTWQPPFPGIKIESRLANFERALLPLYRRRKAKPNLHYHQQRTLEYFQANDDTVFAHADKNLGPVGLKIPRYIKDGLHHLTDPEAYEIISAEAGAEAINELRSEIIEWTYKYGGIISDDATKYIRSKVRESMDDPYGYFYLLYKIHKPKLSTRPVCSDCASMPHSLGQWIDEELQPLVQKQHSYFKNSFELKRELDQLALPANASLFSYDAVSMYTNINTADCIERLSSYLLAQEQDGSIRKHLAQALIDAITIVMYNNRMRFGDILVRQLVGIAMGMSPAPSIANLYVAIHEAQRLLQYIGKFLLYLKRFIDDGLGIWLHDPDPAIDDENWREFQAAVNSGGLTWTFTKRAKTVDFMDLTLEIVNGKIETTLFTKPMCLHLYLPPSSCHAPGVNTGTVYGNVLRIYQLCSRPADIEQKLIDFYGHLLDRGHTHDRLRPLFHQAIENALAYLRTSPSQRAYRKMRQAEASRRRVYLHVPYHPANPSARQLQRIWQEHVFHPRGGTPLNTLTNFNGHPIPIDRLIIAQHRAPNLGNLFSYRKICKRSGLKVSSYL